MASVEPSHDLLVEAPDLALAAVGNEGDLAALAGLEADGRARRDVEPHAAGLVTVEGEGLVGLEEVVVAADLDRPVAGIGDLEGDGGLALVEDEVARCWINFSGYHVMTLSA